MRGRFYLEWQWNPLKQQRETYGRITPLAKTPRELLLEVPRGQNQWTQVVSGSPEKLIKTVAADKKGTFHGLGSVDDSLRMASKAALDRLLVEQRGSTEFRYAETDKRCSVQEVLYHYFGLPIHVIAQPLGWYTYHRTPEIAEFSPDSTRVLVRFKSMSWSGETFGGTCMYAQRDGKWEAYTIRPNQSSDIATAEAWLEKRKWKSWD
jgi:hypothetical protein